MAQPTMTPEDREFLIKQGLNPDTATPAPPEQPPEMSKLGAMGAELKGKAGGILGGGAGALGTMALLAPWLAGPEAGIPADLLMAGGAALGGTAAGMAGEKGQQLLQSDETNQQQQQAMEQAEREHPLVSMATDIGASALASGGSLSLRTPLAALGGDAKALRSVLINSVANPAINSGINYATTGQLPTLSDLSMQALGGAVMSGSKNPLLRIAGLRGVEPSDKNNVPDDSVKEQALTLNAPKQPLALLDQGGPRFLGNDIGGRPPIDVYSQSIPHPDIEGDSAPLSQGDEVEAQTDNGVVKGTKIGEDENGNHTILQEDGTTTTIPKEVTNANQEQSSMENVRSETPQPATPMAEGEPGGLQQTARDNPSEEGGLSDKEEKQQLKGLDLNPEEEDPNAAAVRKTGLPGNINDLSGLRKGEAGFIQLPWMKNFFTKSAIDRVNDIQGHPAAPELATGYKKALNERTKLVGQFQNPIIEAGKKLNNADLKRVNEIKNQEMSTGVVKGPLNTDSDAVKNYYKVAKQMYSGTGDYAIAKRIPITVRQGYSRLMKKNPAYWAGMASQKVEDIYRKNTDQVAIKKLDDIFNDHNQTALGMSPQESQKYVDNWKKSVQGDLRGSDVSHQDWFNALRKMQGEPLPPEFREQNPVKNDARYASRFSAAASHYNNVESNPRLMAALGQTKDAWGNPISQPFKEGSLATNPDVKSVVQSFHTDPEDSAERRERSMSGISTASLIAGPPLEVHKLISNEVKSLSFARNPYQAVAMLAHGLINIKQGYRTAVDNGVMKLTAASAKDMFDGTLSGAERMNGVARTIRQVATVFDLTTKFNAAMMQSQMEYIIPSKISRANAGSVTDQKFINRLDPDYKMGKTYSPQEQKDLASLAAQYIHGTGDVRQMPGWMMKDGELAGFFSLAHWSVAQTNNFIHDVLEPAQRGDLVPLVTSVFGATVGGLLIKELRQDISGKKNPIPSLEEIQSSEGGLAAHKSLLAYNMIAAMQYSGFGGLLSQIAKYPFDFAYKNQPQGATFPLDELASDFSSTIKNVSSAIANDPNLNWIDMAAAVTQHTLSNNLMLSRIALNQGINAGLITGLPAEKKALSDRLNQLRRFDEIQGLPYNDIDEGQNPYMNLEQKKFKYSQDPQEAIQQVPSLISGIMQAYQGKPDVIMAKLKGLKENQYSTFPSMESMPLEFYKYLGYLHNLKGPQAAQDELQDYIKHKAINQVKASVVP